MKTKTRLTAGLAVCLLAAALMISDLVSTEVGLVVGTMGALLTAAVPSHSSNRKRSRSGSSQ